VIIDHAIIPLNKGVQCLVATDGMDEFIAIKGNILAQIVVSANYLCPCSCRHPSVLEVRFAAGFQKSLCHKPIIHCSADQTDGPVQI
jgi:hypothetical protein